MAALLCTRNSSTIRVPGVEEHRLYSWQHLIAAGHGSASVHLEFIKAAARHGADVLHIAGIILYEYGHSCSTCLVFYSGATKTTINKPPHDTTIKKPSHDTRVFMLV